MFAKLDDFIQTWTSESESTQKLFAAMTDESLKQEVIPNGRTLGRLAWHITTTIQEMTSHTGLQLDAVGPEAPVPQKASEIYAAYTQASEYLVKALKEQWTDESLLAENNMYGEMWKNNLTLYVILSHQTHHRGQMTVLMRQAGLVIPGVCGPSYEEWKAFGMEAPTV